MSGPLNQRGTVRDSDLPWIKLKPSGDTTGARDTAALIAAYVKSPNVRLLSGTFHFNGTVTRPTGSTLKGTGPNSTFIKKVGTALSYVAADTATYNALFVLPEGSYGHETSGFTFSNEDGTSTAVFTLLELTFENQFFGMRGGKLFDYSFRECRDFFKTSFRDIRLNSCRHGFDFRADKFKTSLTFDNCYAYNCGTGYILYKTYYTALTACAADYIAGAGTAWGDLFDVGGFGSPDQAYGVYDFSSCRSISVAGCGAESSYGNGLLRWNASTVSVNGLRGYDIRSSYVPNYGSYPDFFVGPIQSNTEAGQGSSVVLNGVDIDTWTNDEVDEDMQAIIAYNHATGAYGDPGVTVVQHSRMRLNACPATHVGGSGPKANVKDTSSSIQDFGDYRVYGTKVVTAETTSTTLRIPFLSQSGSNRRGYCLIRMISDEANLTNSRAGIAEFGFYHLTSVAGVSTLRVAGNVASIAASTLHIDITLTVAVTSLKISVEYMSSRASLDYFDYANIALV